ncbi:hypothetical protein EV561_11790 [Rhizobium sp. BK376]|nr:hypothetical protein EV561_11790 [Rhizobium sp. BK376]
MQRLLPHDVWCLFEAGLGALAVRAPIDDVYPNAFSHSPPPDSIGFFCQTSRHAIKAVRAFRNNNEAGISVSLVPSGMHVDAVVDDRVQLPGEEKSRRKFTKIGMQRSTTQIRGQRWCQSLKGP